MSLPVEAAATAAEIVRHSWQRGRIENFFRMLKAGRRVERLAFRPAAAADRD